MFRLLREPVALPAAAVRFSGHTIVDRSELSCCPARPRAARRPAGLGSLPVSTLALARSGPFLRAAAADAQAGWGLASARAFGFTPSLSPFSPPTKADSSRAGHARTAEGGWAARGHASNLWLPGEGGREAAERPGSAGEVAPIARSPCSYFIIMRVAVRILLGGGGERQPPAPMKPVLGVAHKPCSLSRAARGVWGVRRLGGIGRWRLPAHRGEKSLLSGASIKDTQTRGGSAPCSSLLGCWGTWAASLVKCRAAERPGSRPSGPPKRPKCRRVGRVSESCRVEKDRRYGVGEGPGRLEWVLETLSGL